MGSNCGLREPDGLARLNWIADDLDSDTTETGASDPRVIDVTGLSMTMTAQGADHTVGNLPRCDCVDKILDHLDEKRVDRLVLCAAADSLGRCTFGRSVTSEPIDFRVNTLNDAFGPSLVSVPFVDIGKRTLHREQDADRAAGFSVSDDALPTFFSADALEPAYRTARFYAAEVDVSPTRWAS